MKEAMFSKRDDKGGAVQCLICPHRCLIREGAVGICRTRTVKDGVLYSTIADYCCSVNLDPIEKKPLYHFYPGSWIMSLGTFGCNLSCLFCQNWTLSHVDDHYLTAEGIKRAARHITPADALELAYGTAEKGNIGIAYTYNEPSIWYEYVLEASRLLKEKGLVNVLVTNGYLAEEPQRNLLPYIDAVNVDIKSINPDFYKKYCRATLEPVLRYCEIAKESALVEITNLVIPTLNDSDEDFTKLTDWVEKNLGRDVPLHFSRYHPDFRMDIEATPVSTLERAYQIASGKLRYVYVGNVMSNAWNNTRCPGCGKAVIKREGMGVSELNLDDRNCCAFCGAEVQIRGKCRRSW